MKKPRPFLLSILLYSLLTVLLIILVVNLFFVFNMGAMDDLYTFFYTSSYGLPIKNRVFASSLIIILAIFSVVFMLKRKLYGLYIFAIVSVLVIVYLLLIDPIDQLNITVLIALNTFLFLFKSSIKLNVFETAEEQNDTSVD